MSFVISSDTLVLFATTEVRGLIISVQLRGVREVYIIIIIVIIIKFCPVQFIGCLLTFRLNSRSALTKPAQIQKNETQE
jgi:hypothetical protein